MYNTWALQINKPFFITSRKTLIPFPNTEEYLQKNAFGKRKPNLWSPIHFRTWVSLQQ